MIQEGSLDPQAAISIMKRMMKTLLGQQFEDCGFEEIRLVMMREQAAPSENFDLIYNKTLKPLHELFSKALSVATGEDPASTKVVLRTHAVFGQVLTFKLARATILRRLGVTKLDRSHMEMISEILDEHVDLICEGLAKKGKAR